ncbi:MAG: gamma-glutamyltransferase [Bacteroidota bacterium]
MKHLIFSLILFIGCQATSTSERQHNTSPETGPLGQEAMISSAHPLATKVGIDILKNGGNAFDAAIAVQFALAVVFPRAGNLGGGGFAVFRTTNGETGSLDFREKAPLKADRDMYLDQSGNVVDGLSTVGHLAAGIPGSVDGMFKLHEKFGFKPMAELVQPAINLAFYGYKITEDGAFQLNRFQEVFKQYNGEDFYLLKKEGWKGGDSLMHKDLAFTLTQIRDLGRDGFYGGIVGDQMVKEMKIGNGLFSIDDLEGYEARWRDPVIGSYRGHQVISMPPPSSGGVALLQLLQGAEAYNIKEMGHNTAETIHTLTELERRVYADRATHLGDPDFYDVPVSMLLDRSYNKKRFSNIKKNKKTDSQKIKEGDVEVIESVETTHFSVVDPEGNAVSITTTLNGFFGCKVMVKGAGFFLNNEMDDFSAKPGVPNMFGLVGGEANAIEPEKRMLSSMTPTIVAKDGKLKMVVGTPGGSTIITSVFQTILNVIDHDMSMQDAVNAKRVHSQWLPDLILVEEGGLSDNVLKKLKRKGHEIDFRESMGRMDCVLIREDGQLEGGPDYTRGDNYAEGF